MGLMPQPMQLFALVNALFVAAFVGLVILRPPWLGWVVFVVAWCAADFWLARDVHLAWWHWAVLLAGLTAIDVAVLYAMGQI